MKRIMLLLLCFSFLLVSCGNGRFASTQDNTGNSILAEKPNKVIPFVTVNEEKAKEQVLNLDWTRIINSIPGESYIQIDGFHSTPVSATLYKNSEHINLSINDPRLIRLLNFYNNEVYCGIYSHSQGTANELYEDEQYCDFRLEITFLPNQSEHNSSESSFDKIIVINGHFYCFRTYAHFEKYSYSAFLRIPLYDVGNLNWLSVFEF